MRLCWSAFAGELSYEQDGAALDLYNSTRWHDEYYTRVDERLMPANRAIDSCNIYFGGPLRLFESRDC